VENTSNWLQGLTQAEQHKYYTLKAIYGDEDAARIAKVLRERGRNSYSKFIDRMNMWSGEMPEKDRELYIRLYLVFALNATVTTNEIIEKVTEARAFLGLDYYRSKVKQRCEAVFFDMFVVQDEEETVFLEGSNVLRHIGYTPLARTKPKDK
jgi:hypothetical protein